MWASILSKKQLNIYSKKCYLKKIVMKIYSRKKKICNLNQKDISKIESPICRLLALKVNLILNKSNKCIKLFGKKLLDDVITEIAQENSFVDNNL